MPVKLAGVRGIEPRLPGPKPGVLPLDDTPVGCGARFRTSISRFRAWYPAVRRPRTTRAAKNPDEILLHRGHLLSIALCDAIWTYAFLPQCLETLLLLLQYLLQSVGFAVHERLTTPRIPMCQVQIRANPFGQRLSVKGMSVACGHNWLDTDAQNSRTDSGHRLFSTGLTGSTG